MIEALGGTVIEYAGMRKCCGFPIITMNKEASLKQAGRHLGDAMDAEADCLVTPCPLCHLNLDLQQPLAEKAVGRELRDAGPAPPPARRPRAGPRAQGARAEPPRRAPHLGDRLVHVGRRRSRLGCARRPQRRGEQQRRSPIALEARRSRVKILTVVGNRPQFIKAAAVSGLLRAEHEEVLVHTGQHYDDALSEVFFRELGLAQARARTGDRRAARTPRRPRACCAALEPLLAQERPDAVLVYGDTNSTLAGALAAAQARACRWCTWRRGCARSTARCPRSSTACSPTT